MKLNHMICPRCGHDFYVEAAYGTCDACQCFFYAGQSKTCNQPISIYPRTTAVITTTPVDWGPTC